MSIMKLMMFKSVNKSFNTNNIIFTALSAAPHTDNKSHAYMIVVDSTDKKQVEITRQMYQDTRGTGALNMVFDKIHTIKDGNEIFNWILFGHEYADNKYKSNIINAATHYLDSNTIITKLNDAIQSSTQYEEKVTKILNIFLNNIVKETIENILKSDIDPSQKDKDIAIMSSFFIEILLFQNESFNKDKREVLNSRDKDFTNMYNTYATIMSNLLTYILNIHAKPLLTGAIDTLSTIQDYKIFKNMLDSQFEVIKQSMNNLVNCVGKELSNTNNTKNIINVSELKNDDAVHIQQIINKGIKLFEENKNNLIKKISSNKDQFDTLKAIELNAINKQQDFDKITRELTNTVRAMEQKMPTNFSDIKTMKEEMAKIQNTVKNITNQSDNGINAKELEDLKTQLAKVQTSNNIQKTIEEIQNKIKDMERTNSQKTQMEKFKTLELQIQGMTKKMEYIQSNSSLLSKDVISDEEITKLKEDMITQKNELMLSFEAYRNETEKQANIEHAKLEAYKEEIKHHLESQIQDAEKKVTEGSGGKWLIGSILGGAGGAAATKLTNREPSDTSTIDAEFNQELDRPMGDSDTNNTLIKEADITPIPVAA